MDFNDKMRYDPELRAKVEEVHKARQAVLLKAAEALKDIYEEMRPLGIYDDDSIYNRCLSAVGHAYYKVQGDADFMQKIGGETYVGNLAAGQLGHIIEGKKW